MTQIYIRNKATQPELPKQPAGFKLKSTLVDDSKTSGKKKDKCCWVIAEKIYLMIFTSLFLFFDYYKILNEYIGSLVKR